METRMRIMWRNHREDKRNDIFEKGALIGYYKNPEETDGDGS